MPGKTSQVRKKHSIFESRGTRGKRATMMAARIDIGIGGLLLAMSPTVQGETNWSLVAPRSNTLPNGEPPSSFDRRENIVSPLGVSAGLDARPALLHTNKFYSNLLVRVISASVRISRQSLRMTGDRDTHPKIVSCYVDAFAMIAPLPTPCHLVPVCLFAFSAEWGS